MKMRKRTRRTDVKAFLKDLKRLDRKLLISFIVVVLILLFVSQKSFFTAGQNGTVFGIHTTLLDKPAINTSPIDIPQPALYPKKSSNVPAPLVSAQAAIVIDIVSQVVLFAKNQDEQFPPASTTKIMTALVALDQFAPDEILTVGQISVEGSKMHLVVGEQILFENLLYGLLLNSGNDAAETMARNFPEGEDAFIDAMNDKAAQLNLLHTHLQNVSGLSLDDHYTTALDLARLASIALKNNEFAKVVATRQKTVTDVTGTYIHHLENLNKLLSEVEGVVGVKTGFTEEAGQVLVASATRNGNSILTVVLKSEDRFLDSRNLLEWAFANHTFEPIQSSQD